MMNAFGRFDGISQATRGFWFPNMPLDCDAGYVMRGSAKRVIRDWDVAANSRVLRK